MISDTEDELLSYQATPFQVVGLEKLLYVAPKDPDPALPIQCVSIQQEVKRSEEQNRQPERVPRII